MNGLQYIRIRCNFSLAELAKQLGITRQAVSAWENGTKEIPKERLQQLLEFFGVEDRYFGEIGDAEQQELLLKAMFRLDIDGKEKYTYHLNHTTEPEKIYFIDNREESFDSSLAKAKKHKKDLLQKIDKLIDPRKIPNLFAYAETIEGGCEKFEIMTTLLEEIPKQDRYLKIPFYIEMSNVFDAMLVVFAGKDMSVIENTIVQQGLTEYEDVDYIKQLVEIFSNHWEEKKKVYNDMYYNPENRKSAREWAKKIREENSKLSREELIRKAEKEIKENGKVGKGTVNTHYTQ